MAMEKWRPDTPNLAETKEFNMEWGSKMQDGLFRLWGAGIRSSCLNDASALGAAIDHHAVTNLSSDIMARCTENSEPNFRKGVESRHRALSLIAPISDRHL
jgi:hypothetical protein